MKLPSGNKLFETFFYPQYEKKVLQKRRQRYEFTMPDVVQNDHYVGLKASDICGYDSEYTVAQIQQINRLPRQRQTGRNTSMFAFLLA